MNCCDLLRTLCEEETIRSDRAREDFKIERKYFRENIINSQILNILLDVENIFVHKY